MMLAAFLILATPPVQIGDYFPSAPGTKWVYREEINEMHSSVEDRVMPSITLGDQPAFAIASVVNGSPAGRTYYRIVDDKVTVVAFDSAEPIASPYVILQLAEAGKSWKYSGPANWYAEGALLHLEGSVKAGDDYEHNDREVPTLEVRLRARLEWLDTIVQKSDQTAVYAKGIGLVSLREEQTIGEKETEMKRELVSFTPGDG